MFIYCLIALVHYEWHWRCLGLKSCKKKLHKFLQHIYYDSLEKKTCKPFYLLVWSYRDVITQKETRYTNMSWKKLPWTPQKQDYSHHHRHIFENLGNMSLLNWKKLVTTFSLNPCPLYDALTFSPQLHFRWLKD